VGLEQRLVKLEAGAGTTCFRFHPVDRPGQPVLRLWENSLRYGPPPFGFQLVEAVWVNQRDGLIDSVLTIHNQILSPGPIIVRNEAGMTRQWPTDGRKRLFHTDQPFKAAFLRANRHRLPQDLQRLCQNKGIFH
jgi:hypothetical protein